MEGWVSRRRRLQNPKEEEESGAERTAGASGKGKKALGDAKSPKGYYDGIAQGEKNIRKMVAHLFKLHLDYVPKRTPPTKNQQKALQKFEDFLNYEGDEK